jgi:hypothetical protein
VKLMVAPSDSVFSIVYITRPIALNTPENLQISRQLQATEPPVPPDWSQTFITDYSTFPDDILAKLANPREFNDNMNRSYTALKDLVGKDSDLLDANGHLYLIIEDIPACGWAGNPIQMHPVCMEPDMLNTGNPGWGPVHELGHDFVGQHSYFWEETDAHEGWANFMAYYCYDNRIFVNSDYDQAFWNGVWNSSTKPTDIFQGAIVKWSHQFGWNVARVFFRKFLASDPAWGQSNAERQKLAIRYLAEAAMEISGKQETYDNVVNDLVGKGFPKP